MRGRDKIRSSLRFQKSDDLGVGPRSAEQKSLSLMTALRAQAAQLSLGLDAFGGDRHAEAYAEADDRTHDSLRVAISAEVPHERLIDLDLVERKTSEITQTRIAGAEIVHRNAHAKRAQRMQRRKHLAALFQQQGLGDFQL